MQTFLPYQSFTKSLQCLDDKRLGKQRVEALQILNALELRNMSSWKNHPAVKMWRGYVWQLELYHDIAIEVWVKRGFNNSMQSKLEKHYHRLPQEHIKLCPLSRLDKDCSKPEWLTDEFCASHRSNLLRKNSVYYSQFGWTEPDNLPYIWPVK